MQVVYGIHITRSEILETWCDDSDNSDMSDSSDREIYFLQSLDIKHKNIHIRAYPLDKHGEGGTDDRFILGVKIDNRENCVPITSTKIEKLKKYDDFFENLYRKPEIYALFSGCDCCT
jgi:hypothetical protein